MKNPLISVLVTTYNAQQTVIETLNSIAAQTYLNYEIVLVDDGSEDDTVSAIKKWERDNENIQLHLYEPGRLGRAKALNYGVQKARGEWIAICDADDLWHPEKLELQAKVLDCKRNIVVLATDVEVLIGEQNPQESDFRKINKEVKDLTIDELLYENRVCHSSALIRKDVCFYNIKYSGVEDLEFWIRTLDNGDNISILKMPLTYKRLHEDQKFGTNNNFSYRINAFNVRLPYFRKYKKYYLLFLNMSKLFIGLLPKRIRNILSSIKTRYK